MLNPDDSDDYYDIDDIIIWHCPNCGTENESYIAITSSMDTVTCADCKEEYNWLDII